MALLRHDGDGGWPRAEAVAQAPAPQTSVNVQINTEFLNDLMRSAMIFNGMVQNLNLNKTLHESGVSPDSTDPNGRPMKRAAAVLGAGAGVGLAVGGMTGSQKGALIGAVAGSAGAYVIDQIVQHQQRRRPGWPTRITTGIITRTTTPATSPGISRNARRSSSNRRVILITLCPSRT